MKKVLRRETKERGEFCGKGNCYCEPKGWGVHDLYRPTVAGDADSAHLTDVVHAQMHCTGADGLGQTVVGIVLLVREIFQPALDQALG